jgi:hypothetical protein
MRNIRICDLQVEALLLFPLVQEEVCELMTAVRVVRFSIVNWRIVISGLSPYSSRNRTDPLGGLK